MASCSDVEPLTLGDLLGLAGPSAEEEGAFGPSLSLGYCPPAGHPALRSDVAAMLAADAAAVAPAWAAAGGGGGSGLATGPLDPDAVFCAAPQELAALSVTAALEAHAAAAERQGGGAARRRRPRVVVTAPAYPGLVAVAVAHGAEVVPWAPRWTAGGPAFEVADLQAALSDGPDPPALALLNFPHSPTGASLAPPSFAAALAACADAGVGTVVVDELYRLPGSGLPPAVCCAVRGLPSSSNPPTTLTVASLGGLSKWAGLPGLRAGWLAAVGPGAPALLARVGELRDHGTVCGAAPAEALARLGVRARGLLAARAKALLSTNAAAATHFFGPDGSHGAYFDFYDPPPGAPVCFPALKTGEAAAAWADRARREAGVLILPGDTFELASPGDGARFRLGLGRAGFGAALGALGEWLDRGEPLRV